MATTATNKYEILQKISETDDIALHPITDADAVNYNGALKSDATNVETAIDKVNEKIEAVKNGGVVTGIKGDKESEYSTGKYNITPSKIGAYTTTETDTKITNAVTPVNQLAQEAKSLAQGRSRGVSFETTAAMTAALKAASNTEYNVGDSLYIKEASVPDYWVTNVLDNNEGTYGYYEIQILETKIDLTSYQTKNDSGLTTTSKSVVGAINEVDTLAKKNESELSDLNTQVDSISDELTGLVSGTTASGVANKLKTPRNIAVSGAVTGSKAFDGSADITIETTIPNNSVDPTKLKDIADLTEGTFTAVKVNSKGLVTKGAQSIYVGSDDEVTPPATLAIGGLFFKKIS